jgi:hypothetical protein
MADLTDLQASQSIKITGSDSSGIETNFVDATINGLKVDGSAVTQPVSASSLPLPTGAATETTLSGVKTSVDSINTTVNTDNTTTGTKALLVGGATAAGVFQSFEVNASGHLNVADGGGSITVDATSLPLPTGAATETTLASIDSKITAYSQVASGTLTGLNQAVTLSTIGLSSVVIQTTGTFTASYTIEATVDGTNYTAVNCSTQGGNTSAFSTTRGDIVFPCGGYTAVRTRISSFTSGSVVVTMRGSISSANAIKIYQDNTTQLFTASNTRDGNGNSLTSQASGAQRALDVGINVAGVQIDPRSVTLQTGTNTIGSINNISGTISLPTGAATETTLSALNNKINNQGAAVSTSDIVNVAGTQGAFNVTTTATPVRVGASNLTNRKLVTFYHDTSNIVYWGYTSAVTTSTGTPIGRGQFTQWAVGPNLDIYLISTTTVASRITEAS